MLVIPAIDVIEGSCVRLLQGDYQEVTEYSVHPEDQARKYEKAGFERVHVIDLEGARYGQGRERKTVLGIRKNCSLPMQVGGGIRRREDVDHLVSGGIEFMIISTAVTEDPESVEEWVEAFGADRFIVSLDIRDGRMRTSGWLDESSEPIESIINRISGWGIRQVICTDIDRDGTMEQPNLKTMEMLLSHLPSDAFLIAAGGVSSPSQVTTLAENGVQGAVVGRALYEGSHTLEEFLNAG